MKVYISGAVTGIDDYVEHFQKAERYWKEQGNSCINPAAVLSMMPEDTTWEQYMKLSIDMLEMCDAVFMLKGWRKSCGANREFGYALARDMFIIQETDELNGKETITYHEKEIEELAAPKETGEKEERKDPKKLGGGTETKQRRPRIEIEKVLELKDAGKKIKDIADELGVKPQSISAALSNHKKLQKESSEKQENKMKKTSAELCLSCIHGQKIYGGNAVCGYLNNTGKRRGCPEGYCDKYEKRKR